jgi:hypothetical protein
MSVIFENGIEGVFKPEELEVLKRNKAVLLIMNESGEVIYQKDED